MAARTPKPADPDRLTVNAQPDETHATTLARASTTPENLSAAVMIGSGILTSTPVTELAIELKRQTAALRTGDMTRVENMLLAQAHILDAMFGNLVTRALTSKHMANLESLMRLAFKAQSQCRATLQTLGDLKAPKHVAFVKQANIGNQVQVNNAHAPAGKIEKAQNELLEAGHVQRLDTRASSETVRVDPPVAAMGKQHRAAK